MALLTLLSLPLLHYIGVIIYRLYFHPLRHIPGPCLAAASSWYEFYFDVIRDGDLVFQLGRLHKIYGPVVRISPREVHVNDLTLYHQIYKQNTAYIKDRGFYHAVTPSTVVSLINPLEHRQRRELYSPFFSKRAVHALDQLLWGKVDMFCQKITEINGAPIMLGDGFHCLMVDIISEYLFGRSFNMLHELNFNGKQVREMRMMIQGLPVFKHFPVLKDIALLLPDSWAAKVAPGFAHMFKTSEAIVSDLLSKAKLDAPKDDSSQNPLVSGGEQMFRLKHKTIYDALLDQSGLDAKGKRPLSKRELIHESIAFLLAGTETVSLSLIITIFHVLNSPEMQGKLMQELAELKERCGETPALKDLEKLPYLTGVIREGTRLSHGIPGKLPRVVPPSGTLVGRTYLPPKTIIGMSNYYINTNPEFYPEPDRFWPERWTLHTPPEKWYVPFSKGSRSCIGMHLAWADMYLTMAALFMRFDLRLYKTGPNELEWRDYVIPFLRGHLRVVATPKKVV